MAQIILFNPSNGLIVDSLDYWPPWALLYISIKLHTEYSINYDTLDYPWLTKKRKEFFLNLYFTTLLLNPDYEYIKNKMWKYFAKAIYPVTKWRVKHLYFKFSPVLLALRHLKKMGLI